MEHIPCENVNTEACPVYRAVGECYEDEHHLFYPAKRYKGALKKEFRNLEDNKVLECRMLHQMEHALQPTVPMPSLDVMREAVRQERESRKEG